jgi:membrane fusion protein (multidrug efflux system)
MRGATLRALTAVLVSGALTILLSACGSSDASTTATEATKASEDAAIPVEVASPLRGEMRATYSGTATLEAEADAEVVAKVQGELTELRVEEGDRVKAGDVLARLDGRQLRLEVAQVEAELAKLERDYRRQIELNAKGLVAAGTFEGLRYDLDTLRARRDLAQLQLSYTQIRAPFGGVVAARNVRVGQTVQPNTALFRITDPSPLRAQVFVPERELQRLGVGQPAAVQVDAVPGRMFPAQVSLVAPTIDARTATFKVTVEVDDASAVLKPGMFARIGIVFERKQQALQIPRVALVETDGERSVFIVQQGLARQRNVTTGLTDAGNVEITDGIKEGEQVVIVGQSGLKDGNKVRVVSLESSHAAR